MTLDFKDGTLIIPKWNYIFVEGKKMKTKEISKFRNWTLMGEQDQFDV